MAKKNTQSTTVETTDVQEPEMTANTTTQSHELTFALEENATGTSRRLVAYHNAEWVQKRDLSILGLNESKAALEMFAKAAAGNLHGSPKLLLTAPVEKFAYENGTGTMGYVRYDFHSGVDAIEIPLADGTTILLDVDPRDVPDEGYKRLHLNAGKLYSKEWEKAFTERDNDNFMYWYCKVGSVMLDKNANVSVSVGPKLYERAQGVMDVIKSDNPEETNSARMHGNRQASRITRQVSKNTQRFSEQAQAATAADFEVPAAHGGTINLKDWPFNEPIHLRNRAGFGGRTITLEEDTMAARLAAAVAITTEEGMGVDIS